MTAVLINGCVQQPESKKVVDNLGIALQAMRESVPAAAAGTDTPAPAPDNSAAIASGEAMRSLIATSDRNPLLLNSAGSQYMWRQSLQTAGFCKTTAALSLFAQQNILGQDVSASDAAYKAEAPTVVSTNITSSAAVPSKIGNVSIDNGEVHSDFYNQKFTDLITPAYKILADTKATVADKDQALSDIQSAFDQIVSGGVDALKNGVTAGSPAALQATKLLGTFLPDFKKLQAEFQANIVGEPGTSATTFVSSMNAIIHRVSEFRASVSVLTAPPAK